MTKPSLLKYQKTIFQEMFRLSRFSVRDLRLLLAPVIPAVEISEKELNEECKRRLSLKEEPDKVGRKKGFLAENDAEKFVRKLLEKELKSFGRLSFNKKWSPKRFEVVPQSACDTIVRSANKHKNPRNCRNNQRTPCLGVSSIKLKINNSIHCILILMDRKTGLMTMRVHARLGQVIIERAIGEFLGTLENCFGLSKRAIHFSTSSYPKINTKHKKVEERLIAFDEDRIVEFEGLFKFKNEYNVAHTSPPGTSIQEWLNSFILQYNIGGEVGYGLKESWHQICTSKKSYPYYVLQTHPELNPHIKSNLKENIEQLVIIPE